jgi:Pyridoxamine 5'-phosphate oxidase
VRRASRSFGTVSARSGALTIEERHALLREPIIASLSTITPDGYPYVVHVWTEWDGEALWLLCRAKAAFVEHIRERSKVAILVARSDSAQTRVLILGAAEIVEGPGAMVEGGRLHAYALSMARRYRGEAGVQYISESMAWPRVLVRIQPVRFVGWGDIDWHPRYRS